MKLEFGAHGSFQKSVLPVRTLRRKESYQTSAWHLPVAMLELSKVSFIGLNNIVITCRGKIEKHLHI